MSSLIRRVVERLCRRTVLASAIGPDGTLLINGTEQDDVITGSIGGAGDGQYIVTVNGVEERFGRRSFKGLRVLAKGGHDDVRLSTTRHRALIQGGPGNDTLVATRGDDTLHGEAGNDSLVAGSGVDEVQDGDGDDAVLASNDVVYAGAGNDVYRLAERSHTYVLSYRRHAVGSIGMSAWGVVHLGNGEVDAFTGNPFFQATDGDDLLVGNKHGNNFDIGDGNDTVRGVGGDDSVSETPFNQDEGDADLIDLGTGNDSARLYDGDATVIGGPGNDGAYMEFMDDVLAEMGFGDDVVALLGGPLSARRATVNGGPGNDRLHSDCNGTLYGGAGDDTLISGASPELLLEVNAGAGDDAFLAEGFHGARVTYNGNGGFDRFALHVNGSEQPLDVTLDGLANDGPPGGATNRSNLMGDIEQVFGSSMADRIDASARTSRTHLVGGTGDDTLIGGSGSDSLEGGRGQDSLVGGPGDDAIRAGPGADTLLGDAGGDILDGDINDDVLVAADGEADILRGKGGVDVAEVDELLDVVTGVEATS